MARSRKLGSFHGRLVMLGFGSVGQGMLSLLGEAFGIKPSQVTIVRASARTWAVAFSRRLIPGAVFTTKVAAMSYAAALANAAGLNCVQLVVGEA